MQKIDIRLYDLTLACISYLSLPAGPTVELRPTVCGECAALLKVWAILVAKFGHVSANKSVQVR